MPGGASDGAGPSVGAGGGGVSVAPGGPGVPDDPLSDGAGSDGGADEAGGLVSGAWLADADRPAGGRADRAGAWRAGRSAPVTVTTLPGGSIPPGWTDTTRPGRC